MNTWTCWNPDCQKEFEYEDPKYRDVWCPECGIINTIFPPEECVPDETIADDFNPPEEEEEMGKLADRAREKSPYITLQIGEESPVLVYKSWKETTDNFGNDTFRYFFELETENGIVTKHLDNRSLGFAQEMDKINFGEKVVIKREPKLDNEGDPIEKKSVWTVRKVE